MIVRHVVSAANVDEAGWIIDATEARHCVIHAGALLDLAGPVDPLTHLNGDFSDHTLGDCVVAESLEPGAPVWRDAEGRPRFARPRAGARQRRGPVDVGARRIAWLRVHEARRAGAGHAGR